MTRDRNGKPRKRRNHNDRRGGWGANEISVLAYSAIGSMASAAHPMALKCGNGSAQGGPVLTHNIAGQPGKIVGQPLLITHS